MPPTSWRACAGTLRAAGIGPASVSRLMCGNRAEKLGLFLAAAGSAPSPCRSTRRRRVRRSSTSCAIPRRSYSCVEAEYLPLLGSAARAGSALEADLGDRRKRARASVQGVPCALLAAARRAGRAGRRSARRHARRYSTPPARPGRRRACCARTRSITGGAPIPAACSASPADDILHTMPAAVSHQRAQHVRAGAADRRHAGRSSALLGFGLLDALVAARGDRDLSARRDGADPAVPSAARAERAHRVRIALGPGVPATYAEAFRERIGIALLEGYGSTETNFVIGAPIEQQRPGYMGPACGPASRRAWSTRTTTRSRPGRRASWSLRADEPHAFATGYFGMPEETVEAWRNLWFHTGDRVVARRGRLVPLLSTGSRTRSAGAARTSPPSRSSRCCSSHPAVEIAAASSRCPRRSAEDEVMAAVVAAAGSRARASSS